MIIVVIHGPNLGALGRREPEIYGTITLKQIDDILHQNAREHNVILKTFQTNHEGKIIDLLEEHQETSDAVIINPGALAHTSIALMDAIKAYGKPAVEVHLTDLMLREEFRHNSYTSLVVEKSFTGLGIGSYVQALQYLIDLSTKRKKLKT